MTIASAFNEIAVANGGTADNSGTIAGAVDALTDALAGSDVAQGATIEDGVRVLGEYIGGGGGGGGAAIGGNMIGWPLQYSADSAPHVGVNVGSPSFACIGSLGASPAAPIADGFTVNNHTNVCGNVWSLLNVAVSNPAGIYAAGIDDNGNIAAIYELNLETSPGLHDFTFIKLPEISNEISEQLGEVGTPVYIVWDKIS